MEPSFDTIAQLDDRPWTAALALDLLPPNNGPRVEVYRGSVLATPRARPLGCAAVESELVLRLRERGLSAYLRSNVVVGDDLFIPDIVVLRRRGKGRAAAAADVLLLGEVIADDRPCLIDRPRAYAGAGFGHYLTVDCRDRTRPRLILHRLEDGGLGSPVADAAAGTMFMMKEPFAFEVDPAELLDE